MKKLAKLAIAFATLTALSTGLLALPYLTISNDGTVHEAALVR